MKFIKTIMAGAALALGLSGVAQAATQEFYICGSTAFRSNFETACMHVLGSTDYVASSGTGTLPGGTTADGYPYGWGQTGSSLNLGGASQTILTGSNSTVGAEICIHTCWTGSESGIYAVGINSGTGASPAGGFIPLAVSGTNTPLLTTGTFGLTAGTSHVPDACMSDTYQSTSQWYGGSSNEFYDGSYHSMATLNAVTGDPVAVTYFTFLVSNSGSAAGISNITSEQAKYLYGTAGKLPLPYLAPGTANTSAYVYALGRDPDSGTRLTTMGEIGNGNLGGVVQYNVYDSGTNQITSAASTISFIKTFPATTVNSQAIGIGNGGYNSGGNLVKATAAENAGGSSSPFKLNSVAGSAAATGSCLISYASLSDGANINGHGIFINYNGVPATNTNVQLGTYPLWTYEHMYLSTNIGATQSTIAQTIANQIKTVDYTGTGCVQRSSMKVERDPTHTTGDGGAVITPGTL
jgi:hypothetical protein